MSALAQALIDRGEAVSGSDRLLDRGDATEVLRRLRAQGVVVHAQDGSGVQADVTRLIVSTAIESDNSDLIAANARDIPVVHRAAALAGILAGRRQLAVTGTCGKSTVTAMTGWLLSAAGFDPLVVNGAGVVGWDHDERIGAVRRGSGVWAVFEADESDRSLMVFEPEVAVITNASADHFPLADTEQLFARFRQRVRGAVVDDAAGGPERIRLQGWRGTFAWAGVEFTVPLPGRHNVLNAWMAVRAAQAAGAAPEHLVDALAGFRGVDRRLERVGEGGGVTVVDDYAHNPAKLAAAWTALAAAFPRVAAVWRPHGYGPLRNMLENLADALAKVIRPDDALYILPVYDAGGTADRSVGSTDLVARLAARGVAAHAVPDADVAAERLLDGARPGTVLATLGARDPDLPRLARRLVAALRA